LTSIIVETYEGEKDEGDRYHGKGNASYVGGHAYEGQFSKGRMHGEGKYTFADGVVYEGDFEHNRIKGKGKYTWTDESVYEGDVVDGKRDGEGTFVCVTCPSRYEGQWKKGQRHGEGSIWYDAKKRIHYSGSWKEGKRHGKGTMCYKSGSKYEGMWENNLKHGEGTMIWLKSNEKYTGHWKNDLQDGYGEHLWMEADRSEYSATQKQMCNNYKGQFKAGKRHGSGIFSYANGSVYEGDWVDNQKDGVGVFIFDDGTVYEGPFKQDRMCGQRPRRHEEDKRSNPKELSLNLDDLFPNMTIKQREREANEVNNTLLRFNSEYKAIYAYYSKLHANQSHESFTMKMSQLWQFCKDCKLPTPTLPLADINRIFQKIQRAHDTEVELAKQKRRMKESGAALQAKDAMAEPIRRKMSNANQTLDGDLHDPDRPILYRVFMEAIVRIADARFIDEVDVNLEKRNLAWKVLTMFNENVKENTELVMKKGGGSDNFSHKMMDPTVVHALDAYKGALNKIFFTYCKADKNSFSTGNNDSTMNVREYLVMLRDCGLITPEFSIHKARSIFLGANYETEDENDADNLETEVIFSEFKEAIARIAEAIGPADQTLHGKIEHVVGKQLLPGSRKFDTGVSTDTGDCVASEAAAPESEPQEQPAS